MVTKVTYFSTAWSNVFTLYLLILHCVYIVGQAQMSWEAATRIRSYEALILVLSLLTCHSPETSLNALGSCDLLTPSEAQLEKYLVGNLSIKVVSPRGYKGSMSTEADPPVSPDAFNASSMSSLGETSSLSETCSVISMP